MPDFIFSPSESVDENVIAFVYFRPWVNEFLRMMEYQYELVCYTASIKGYGQNEILYDYLFTQIQIHFDLFKFTLSADAVSRFSDCYLKSLEIKVIQIVLLNS